MIKVIAWKPQKLDLELVRKQLSSEEQSRMDQMARGRATEFALGRFLIRNELAKSLKKNCSDIQIRLTDLGKPFCIDEGAVEFSLSHQAGFYLLGVSEKPIGVDFQSLDSKKDLHLLSRKLMNGTDLTDWESLHQKNPKMARLGFFRRWVLSEAFAKCRGESILSVLANKAEWKRFEAASENFFSMEKNYWGYLYPAFKESFAGVVIQSDTKPKPPKQIDFAYRFTNA